MYGYRDNWKCIGSNDVILECHFGVNGTSFFVLRVFKNFCRLESHVTKNLNDKKAEATGICSSFLVVQFGVLWRDMIQIKKMIKIEWETNEEYKIRVETRRAGMFEEDAERCDRNLYRNEDVQ